MDSQDQTTSQFASSALDRLTPREKDILKLLAIGTCNRDIAEKPGLSEKTVRNRISEILDKIGVSNRTQAALWARENGINGD